MSSQTSKKNIGAGKKVSGVQDKKTTIGASQKTPGTEQGKKNVPATQKPADAFKKNQPADGKQAKARHFDERDGTRVDTKMTSLVGMACVSIVILGLGTAGLVLGIVLPMQDLLIVGSIFLFAGSIFFVVAMINCYRGCLVRKNKVGDQPQPLLKNTGKDHKKDLHVGEGMNYLEGQDINVDFSKVKRQGSPPQEELYGKDPVINLAEKTEGPSVSTQWNSPTSPKVAMPVAGDASGRTTVLRRMASMERTE